MTPCTCDAVQAMNDIARFTRLTRWKCAPPTAFRHESMWVKCILCIVRRLTPRMLANPIFCPVWSVHLHIMHVQAIRLRIIGHVIVLRILRRVVRSLPDIPGRVCRSDRISNQHKLDAEPVGVIKIPGENREMIYGYTRCIIFLTPGDIPPLPPRLHSLWLQNRPMPLA
jgi:hypothetical protein